MIQPNEIANRIWNSDDDIVNIESSVSLIIKSDGVEEDLEVATILEEYLPVVKEFLRAKISEERNNYTMPKFVFSESSEDRLISSVHLGKSELLGRLTDNILSSIHDCNEISKSKGGDDIFRITSITLKSSVQIKRPVKSEAELKNFIEALYKTLYESAGERDLRIPEKFYTITDQNGEIKTIDDFILFHIKHLRSYFDHDYLQMDNPEKKIELIVSTCTKYCGKTTILGLTSEEFLKMQEKILTDINLFFRNS